MNDIHQQPVNKCVFIHKWIIVKDTGKLIYRECEICKLRRCQLLTNAGYEKINDDWLHHKTDNL